MRQAYIRLTPEERQAVLRALLARHRELSDTQGALPLRKRIADSYNALSHASLHKGILTGLYYEWVLDDLHFLLRQVADARKRARQRGEDSTLITNVLLKFERPRSRFVSDREEVAR